MLNQTVFRLLSYHLEPVSEALGLKGLFLASRSNRLTFFCILLIAWCASHWTMSFAFLGISHCLSFFLASSEYQSSLSSQSCLVLNQDFTVLRSPFQSLSTCYATTWAHCSPRSVVQGHARIPFHCYPGVIRFDLACPVVVELSF